MEGVVDLTSTDEADEEVMTMTSSSASLTSPWTDKDKDKDSSRNVATPSPQQQGHQRALKLWKDSDSAYLQHLAEICHDMLEDERWRVPGDGRRLFAWENGDDLSAALTFARYFRSESTKNRDENDVKEEDDNDEEDDLEARALLLHARLFLRKGPWFTIDDIYARYYAPNARSRRLSNSARKALQEEDEQEETQEGALQDLDEAGKDAAHAKPSPFNFFLPRTRKQSVPKPSTEPPLGASSAGPDDTVALQELVQDLHRLHRMALIRTFASEEECGIVVGNNANNHAGVALTVEQRKVVLQKLGAVTAPPRSASAQGKFGQQRPQELPPAHRKRRRSSGPNEIWKQMSCQRSIFTTAPNSQGKPAAVLLPVRRHVNDVLLDKLADRIVSATLSATDAKTNSKSRSRKEKMADCLSTIRRLWKQAAPQTKGTGYQQPIFTCFRIREAPLLTLRRMARLYLCAGGGPGSMRGDGTNGWMSVQELPLLPDTEEDSDAPPAFIYGLPVPPPPTACCWHLVTYPGLMYRLGRVACHFVPNFCPQTRQHKNAVVPPQQHKRTDKDIDKDAPMFNAASSSFMTHVFATVDDFRRWELAAEIRANLDYAVVLHELSQYVSRRNARELEQQQKKKLQRKDSRSSPAPDESRGADPEILEEPNTHQKLTRPVSFPAFSGPSEKTAVVVPGALDVLGILTRHGRRNLIRTLLPLPCETRGSMDGVDVVSASVERMFQCIRDGTVIGDAKAHEPSNHNDEEEHVFGSDAHEMLVGWSVLLFQVLQFSFVQLRRTNGWQSSMHLRPWLRHLSWESALAYALWDCVPVMEKLRQHELALSMLRTILGVSADMSSLTPDTTASAIGIDLAPSPEVPGHTKCTFSQFILSRRVRGKAYERMVIDYTHAERQRLQQQKAVEEAKPKRGRKRGRKKWNFSRSPSSTNSPPSQAELLSTTIEALSRGHIRVIGSDGSIPFSAIRALARRIKAPLSETLNEIWNAEMMELGLRTQSLDASVPDDEANRTGGPSKKGYSEWAPVTDFAVANAIGGGDDDVASGVGKRCSYVGWEDVDDGQAIMAQSRSLTVEELAMEEYASGRLPSTNCKGLDAVAGGWVGWHDEGGHVRALFRIMCSKSILGYTAEEDQDQDTASLEDRTVFLTPYQSSPLDLHVGHSICRMEGGRHGFARGFYERRRRTIEAFLRRLESLDAQGLSDMVFDSVMQQKNAAGKAWTRDAFLQRDLAEVRTLSMLAAGFGGTMLAAMFRCLFFDYRHYSGGLPDLLLVRALYDEDEKLQSETTSRVVALGDWIGEAFATDRVEACRVNELARILVDRDDEYLGCSKSADSTTRSNVMASRSMDRRRQFAVPENSNDTKPLPQRLEWMHNERAIQAECLFVEVKSANDRLDGRQEDWLNLLDRVGHARVCKFGSKEKIHKSMKKDSGGHGEVEETS